MPVRKEFISLTRSDARAELGLTDEKLVISAFGSQGARAMNTAMADLFAIEQANGFPFRHIHAIGSFGKDWMPQLVKEKGVDYENCPAIDLREYIYNMPTLMAAADVIIGRSGSATCNEIAAAGTPCILIPSPNVTNDHQTKNARVLADCGGAVLLPEAEATPQRIYDEVMALLEGDRRESMSAALKGLARPDCADRICDIIFELAKH